MTPPQPPHFTPTVSVDFDETLHPYDKGWTGPIPDDVPPLPGALDFLRALKVKGFNVVILSVRASEPGGVDAIRNWCTKYGLAPFIDGITDVKPHAVAYVDDRAVPYQGNWTKVLLAVDALAAKKKKSGAYKP